jgi:hypothetical protein
MTLDDLRELCLAYVPNASLHPGAHEHLAGELIADWWPAHELGHLMTVPPSWIGETMMGIDDDATPESLCLELAAMAVSRQLLEACGRPDLALDERSETSDRVLSLDGDPRVRQILRRRGVVRVPTTRGGLERKLRRVTGRVA